MNDSEFEVELLPWQGQRMVQVGRMIVGGSSCGVGSSSRVETEGQGGQPEVI